MGSSKYHKNIKYLDMFSLLNCKRLVLQLQIYPSTKSMKSTFFNFVEKHQFEFICT
jgi:hypothetical protein